MNKSMKICLIVLSAIAMVFNSVLCQNEETYPKNNSNDSDAVLGSKIFVRQKAIKSKMFNLYIFSEMVIMTKRGGSIDSTTKDEILRIFKTNQGFKFKKPWINSNLKRYLDAELESEFEVCTSCFLEKNRSSACAFCYEKYSFKASKKIVNPTKYWYSRAG
jgi:hypothetical protein